jgi:hypothetical protein
MHFGPMGVSSYFPTQKPEPVTRLHLPGSILPGGCLPSLRCVIVDLSQFSASINVLGATVPDKFVLSLNPNSTVTRDCEVIWREGLMVGVRFVANDKNQ